MKYDSGDWWIVTVLCILVGLASAYKQMDLIFTDDSKPRQAWPVLLEGLWLAYVIFVVYSRFKEHF